jgi:hypothetical protein
VEFCLKRKYLQVPLLSQYILIKWKPGFSGKMFCTLENPFKTGFIVIGRRRNSTTLKWQESCCTFKKTTVLRTPRYNCVEERLSESNTKKRDLNGPRFRDCIVFHRSNTGVVFSNPTRACAYLPFYLCSPVKLDRPRDGPLPLLRLI